MYCHQPYRLTEHVNNRIEPDPVISNIPIWLNSSTMEAVSELHTALEVWKPSKEESPTLSSVSN